MRYQLRVVGLMSFFLLNFFLRPPDKRLEGHQDQDELGDEFRDQGFKVQGFFGFRSKRPFSIGPFPSAARHLEIRNP